MKQGDIVLVPFPYTDLSSVKTRPALVVSNCVLKGRDVILSGITSQKSGSDEVLIESSDLCSGRLPVRSYVRCGKIATLEKSIVRRVVGELGEAKLGVVLRRISEFFVI